MASTEQVENHASEQPAAMAAEEQPKAAAAAAAAKPVREKKVKAAAKETKPKAPKSASHPPYFQMIKEALLALNEKSGSSPYAIAKNMEEKHKGELPANFRKILGLQLKNSAAKGKLIKIKASYKLSEAGKKDITAKPDAVKKRPQRRLSSAATKPKAAAKSDAKRGRKSTPAKPKQPKSIKSPAKKARKAVTTT